MVTHAFGSRVRGATHGATVTSRPVPAFDAVELDERLGPPALVLPSLGLAVGATVVASVPYVPAATSASDSAVLCKLAELIAG